MSCLPILNPSSLILQFLGEAVNVAFKLVVLQLLPSEKSMASLDFWVMPSGVNRYRYTDLSGLFLKFPALSQPFSARAFKTVVHGTQTDAGLIGEFALRDVGLFVDQVHDLIVGVGVLGFSFTIHEFVIFYSCDVFPRYRPTRCLAVSKKINIVVTVQL